MYEDALPPAQWNATTRARGAAARARRYGSHAFSGAAAPGSPPEPAAVISPSGPSALCPPSLSGSAVVVGAFER